MAVFNITRKADEKDNDDLKNNNGDKDNKDNIETQVDNQDISKEPTVTLDGSLSSAYTKALNLVYAKENIMFSPVTVDNKPELEHKDESDLYVYCCKTSELKNDRFISVVGKLRLAVESKKYSRVILALECDSEVTSKISLLSDYSKSVGVSMYLTRESALNAIINSLRG